MIKSANCQVWTKRGWMKSENLLVGDTIISYNPQRNCTEYDKIYGIETDYGSYHLLGIKTKSYYNLTTKDHPLMTYDKTDKQMTRRPIDDVFLSLFIKKHKVIYNRPFEPYDITLDENDVLWSARLAASFASIRHMPVEYKMQIWNIIENINGIQAQEWIQAAFYWTIPYADHNWMKAMPLRCVELRDMIFHVGAKAGVGIKYGPSTRIKRKAWIIYVSDSQDLSVKGSLWIQEKTVGHVFNIVTENGSFIARRNSSSFISACEKKENI